MDNLFDDCGDLSKETTRFLFKAYENFIRNGFTKQQARANAQAQLMNYSSKIFLSFCDFLDNSEDN